ncbi:MAG TPA: polynucleotide adenylyltransferase [Lachnospiraceae bacterium]|nr:polynucleotide adenylyltransferase [Lachnospiraceae bacterium]
MEMILPENVSYIINKLEDSGYEAYAVGGCVRDTILGRVPLDWDITTSAKPSFIKSCFKRTIDTGIQHGTVTVMIKDTGYEVTTYRIDGEYEDGRHPKSVEFTSNLRLDLERRDFTVNAMAYNYKSGLVDEFGGIQDLKNGIIRCVGNARSRFDEDALRMLRAVRFSGQLGFTIEEKTQQAITEMAGNLGKTSAERIRTELGKLLVSDNPGKIREAYKTGMTKVFLPEFDKMMETGQHNPHHIYTVGEHCVRSTGIMGQFFNPDCQIDGGMYNYIQANVLEKAAGFTCGIDKKRQLMLCLTMLFHDIAKPEVMVIDKNGTGHFHGHPQRGEKMAAIILKRLSFDNETISIVKRLIKYHDYRILPEPCAVRRAAAKIGNDIMPMLFLVQYADILAQNPVTFAEKLKGLDSVTEVYKKTVSENAPLCIKDLAVNGNDLIASGIKKGPEIGKILKNLLDMVLEEPEKNEKTLLLSYVDKEISRRWTE